MVHPGREACHRWKLPGVDDSSSLVAWSLFCPACARTYGRFDRPGHSVDRGSLPNDLYAFYAERVRALLQDAEFFRRCLGSSHADVRAVLYGYRRTLEHAATGRSSYGEKSWEPSLCEARYVSRQVALWLSYESQAPGHVKEKLGFTLAAGWNEVADRLRPWWQKTATDNDGSEDHSGQVRVACGRSTVPRLDGFSPAAWRWFCPKCADSFSRRYIPRASFGDSRGSLQKEDDLADWFLASDRYVAAAAYADASGLMRLREGVVALRQSDLEAWVPRMQPCEELYVVTLVFAKIRAAWAAGKAGRDWSDAWSRLAEALVSDQQDPSEPQGGSESEDGSDGPEASASAVSPVGSRPNY